MSFLKRVAVFILQMFVLFILLLAIVCYASDWTDDQIANAIFKAEGGYKAQYLYGIRSVKYRNETDARRICLNTIRNQRKRHAEHDCGLTYLECLSNRYCPVSAHPLNAHWLSNVIFFLNQEK